MTSALKGTPVLFRPKANLGSNTQGLPRITHHALFQLDLLSYYIAIRETPPGCDLPYPPRPYDGRNPLSDEYIQTEAITRAKKLLRQYWNEPHVRASVTLNMIRHHYLGDWHDPQAPKTR